MSGDYQLAEVRVGKILDGWTLAEAKLPERYQVTVVLIIRPGLGKETTPFEPSAAFPLMVNDNLMVVGRRENINRLGQDCGSKV